MGELLKIEKGVYFVYSDLTVYSSPVLSACIIRFQKCMFKCFLSLESPMVPTSKATLRIL